MKSLNKIKQQIQSLIEDSPAFGAIYFGRNKMSMLKKRSWDFITNKAIGNKIYGNDYKGPAFRVKPLYRHAIKDIKPLIETVETLYNLTEEFHNAGGVFEKEDAKKIADYSEKLSEGFNWASKAINDIDMNITVHVCRWPTQEKLNKWLDKEVHSKINEGRAQLQSIQARL